MTTTERRAAPPDLLTVAAVGLVVYVIVNLVHEGVGHGGMCLVVGGKPIALSSAWWDASYDGVSPWARRAVRAGGTLANLALGGASYLGFVRCGDRMSAHTRYVVWLLAVTNLFNGAGYLMVDPIANFGDWGGFVKDLPHPVAWRLGLCGTGALLTRLTQVWGVHTLNELVGQGSPGGPSRVTLARQLCWLPYAVGGVAFTLAGLLNPQGSAFAITSALSTFGGMVFLAMLPAWVPPVGSTSATPIALGRSTGWLLAGGAAALVLFGLLARSIVFHHA